MYKRTPRYRIGHACKCANNRGEQPSCFIKEVYLNTDFSINYKKTALLFAHLWENNYVCTENSSVTCEVTENHTLYGEELPRPFSKSKILSVFVGIRDLTYA